MQRPISEQIQHIVTSATLDHLHALPVPEGQIWRLTRVVFENRTTNATKARLHILDGSTTIYLAEQLSPLANSLYVDSDPIVLLPHQQLGLEYTGATVGDVIVLYSQGWSSPVDGAMTGVGT